jgi:hypothetical protein
MLRLRHADQIEGREANEIILLNSHDGTSSYQMLAGMFRFVCQNGMVCGDTVHEVRVPHKGDVVGQVIEGAFTVLDSFEAAQAQRDSMQGVCLVCSRLFSQRTRVCATMKGSNPSRRRPRSTSMVGMYV